MQALVSVHCLHYNDLLLDPHSDRRVPHARRDRWLMRVECGASVRAGVGRNVDRRLFEGLTGQRALLAPVAQHRFCGRAVPLGQRHMPAILLAGYPAGRLLGGAIGDGGLGHTPLSALVSTQTSSRGPTGGTAPPPNSPTLVP